MAPEIAYGFVQQKYEGWFFFLVFLALKGLNNNINQENLAKINDIDDTSHVNDATNAGDDNDSFKYTTSCNTKSMFIKYLQNHLYINTWEHFSEKTREASVINSPLEQGWSKNKFGVRMMLKNHGTFLGRKEFVRSIKNDRRCMWTRYVSFGKKSYSAFNKNSSRVIDIRYHRSYE